MHRLPLAKECGSQWREPIAAAEPRLRGFDVGPAVRSLRRACRSVGVSRTLPTRSGFGVARPGRRDFASGSRNPAGTDRSARSTGAGFGLRQVPAMNRSREIPLSAPERIFVFRFGDHSRQGLVLIRFGLTGRRLRDHVNGQVNMLDKSLPRGGEKIHFQ